MPLTKEEKTERYRNYQRTYKRLHPPDKEKVKAYKKKHNKHLLQKMIERKKRAKQKAVDLHNNKCAKCSQSFPLAVYDFHHLDPTTKLDRVNFTLTWDKILVELSKCIMLCANCHRITHHELEIEFQEEDSSQEN